MYRDAEKSRRCCVCYDWDLSSVEYFHHDNFPTTSIPDSEVSSFNAGALKSKVITFETMKLACHVIFEKVKRGECCRQCRHHAPNQRNALNGSLLVRRETWNGNVCAYLPKQILRRVMLPCCKGGETEGRQNGGDPYHW